MRFPAMALASAVGGGIVVDFGYRNIRTNGGSNNTENNNEHDSKGTKRKRIALSNPRGTCAHRSAKETQNSILSKAVNYIEQKA